jgi:signal transduction histidine kinase
VAKNKVRIQIVEDETIIAMEVEDRLKTIGYEVTSISASGEEAIVKAEQDNPDLILMDIVLQGNVDGIEAAERIRTSMDIPIVYLTAYADEKTLARAKLTGPFGYLLKPFGEKDLHTAIEIALYKHGMERELRKAIQFKSEILANVSHELRTPLTVIMGFLDLMERDSGISLTEKNLDRLECSKRNSKILLKLINNLLTVSSIDAGEPLIFGEKFDLRELVHKCVEDRQGMKVSDDVKVVENLADKAIEMVSDERKITAIVECLFSNALKFTEKGTVSVSASSCPDRPDWACVEVRDEGIGIAKEDQKTIFEKFKQLDGSLTRKFAGNGLGLYIVKTYVEMLSGEITVDSEPRKGSTFTVKIPRKAIGAGSPPPQ